MVRYSLEGNLGLTIITGAVAASALYYGNFRKTWPLALLFAIPYCGALALEWRNDENTETQYIVYTGPFSTPGSRSGSC
jgi:hypothetical protein